MLCSQAFKWMIVSSQCCYWLPSPPPGGSSSQLRPQLTGLTVETLIARILQEDAMRSSTSSTPATPPLLPLPNTCNEPLVVLLAETLGDHFDGQEVFRGTHSIIPLHYKLVATVVVLVMLSGIVVPSAENNNEMIGVPVLARLESANYCRGIIEW
ncbi:hypothetical protein GOP47_0029635 [Adiantum capillus-veneris]|nr:hypothetical protein GOP47_0029635 [Adiantum capillus-veneris]